MIDGVPSKTVMLPLPNHGTVVQLATGLQNTNHSLVVYIKNRYYGFCYLLRFIFLCLVCRR